MNRRRFLKLMGLSPLAAVAKLPEPEPLPEITPEYEAAPYERVSRHVYLTPEMCDDIVITGTLVMWDGLGNEWTHNPATAIWDQTRYGWNMIPRQPPVIDTTPKSA